MDFRGSYLQLPWNSIDFFGVEVVSSGRIWWSEPNGEEAELMGKGGICMLQHKYYPSNNIHTLKKWIWAFTYPTKLWNFPMKISCRRCKPQALLMPRPTQTLHVPKPMEANNTLQTPRYLRKLNRVPSHPLLCFLGSIRIHSSPFCPVTHIVSSHGRFFVRAMSLIHEAPEEIEVLAAVCVARESSQWEPRAAWTWGWCRCYESCWAL